MLKFQSSFSCISESKIKCGEIFCRSFNDFIIFCTFCPMKSFHVDDFVFHIQNVHSKSEVSNGYKQVDLGNETGLFEKNISDVLMPSEDVFEVNVTNETKKGTWDKEEWTSSNDSDNESWEDENLRILKNSRKKNKLTRNRKNISHDQVDVIETTELKYQNKLKDVTESSSQNKKGKVNEYNCIECRRRFLQKKYLDEHVRDLHNGYKCSLCDKRFNRTSHVECHLKTHSTEKKFSCPVKTCSRKFIDEDYLKRHLEVHTMDRNFICEFGNCGKAFQTQRRLASHEYTHKIPKKFVCDICGYCCRSNSQLITHQRVHTGEKPFPCEICKKPFISKVALQEHMISHSKTRPHVCAICNKAFSNRRVLVRHSFIHSEDKTFKCKLCESSFKHPNSLQGHMRHVHKEPKHKTVL